MKFVFSFWVLFSITSCSNVKKKEGLIEDKSKIVSVSEKAVPAYQKNYKTLNVKGKVKEIVCINYIQFVPNSDLDNNVTKMNYKFDTKGNIIEEICILKDDELNYRELYSYDKMNNALRTQGFDKKNNLIYIIKYSLNKQGFLVFQDYQEDKPEHSYKSYTKYEKITDTLVIYNTHTTDGYNSREIERYKNGNLVSRDYYSDGKLSWRDEYKYDSRYTNAIS
jgi:hypothetical protein